MKILVNCTNFVILEMNEVNIYFSSHYLRENMVKAVLDHLHGIAEVPKFSIQIRTFEMDWFSHMPNSVCMTSLLKCFMLPEIW